MVTDLGVGQVMGMFLGYGSRGDVLLGGDVRHDGGCDGVGTLSNTMRMKDHNGDHALEIRIIF